MTEMFSIPESWSWTTLGEIAEVVGGVTKDGKKQSDPNLPLTPYLRVANVQRGHLDLQKITQIRVPQTTVSKLCLQPGDVLLNEGGDRDKLGRGWVWEGQIENCIHQNHVFRARLAKGTLHPKLLAWFANECAREWFDRNGKQSVNLASISLSAIRRLPVPIPPLAAQHRIVATLEDYLSRLDNAESNLSVATRRLRNLSKSLLRNTFEGLVLRGELTRRLSDVAVVAGGQTPKGVADQLQEAPFGDSIPFYKVGDMNRSDGRCMNSSRTYISRGQAATFGLKIRPPGTVLLPKRGGAILTNKKRIMTSWGTYDLNTMGVIPSDDVDPVFLWYWFQHIDLAQLADGSNVPQINNTDLVDLRIPIPSRSEQGQIVSQLDDQFGGVRRLEAAAKSPRVAALRRLLIARAFRGELVPQNLSDEPASELLKRVRWEQSSVQLKPKRRQFVESTSDAAQKETLL